MIRKLAPLFLVLTLLLSPAFLTVFTVSALGDSALAPETSQPHDVVLPGAAAYLAPPTLRPSTTPSITPTSTKAVATSTPTTAPGQATSTPAASPTTPAATATTGLGTNTPIPATITPIPATNTPIPATSTPAGTATPTATFIPGTTPTPLPPTPTPPPTESAPTTLPPGVVEPTPPEGGVIPPDATVTAIVIPPPERPEDGQAQPPLVETPTLVENQAVGGVGGANVQQAQSSDLVQGQNELPRISTNLETESDSGGGFQPGPQLFLILGAAALALAAGLVIYLRRQL